MENILNQSVQVVGVYISIYNSDYFIFPFISNPKGDFITGLKLCFQYGDEYLLGTDLEYFRYEFIHLGSAVIKKIETHCVNSLIANIKFYLSDGKQFFLEEGFIFQEQNCHERLNQAPNNTTFEEEGHHIVSIFACFVNGVGFENKAVSYQLDETDITEYRNWQCQEISISKIK